MPDWRHSLYYLLLITASLVGGGHGRIPVRDLIKYALLRKVVCDEGKHNQPCIALQENLYRTRTLHVNARPSLWGTSRQFYITQIPPTLVYLVWMYNEWTARVTVLTQQIIGINVIGKLLYNTLLVLTRFLKRGGGVEPMMCKFMFYI